MNHTELHSLLEEKVQQFNNTAFIEPDPISVPHRFTQKQDIEIAGLFAALLAWGNRTTIINSCNRLMKLMDEAPYDFIKNHSENERQRFEKWVHRTFQFPDLLYFLEFLQFHYTRHPSLETAFSAGLKPSDRSIEKALIHFHSYFFLCHICKEPRSTCKARPEKAPANDSICTCAGWFAAMSRVLTLDCGKTYTHGS